MSLINGNNFIFIHIYKCGGMSLRNVFTDNLVTVELNKSHATAKEIKDYCYENGGKFYFDTAFKFSFVRNPFDWIVSLYEFIRNNPNHDNYEEVKNLNFSDFCSWNIKNIKDKKENPNGNFNTLTEFLFDKNGELLVDFVGKIENYDEDIKVILKRLKIPEQKMPKINTSNRKPDYKDYYDDKTIKLVTDFFYYDLVNFNYKF